jgi:biotin carboxyl carrier protein
VMLAAQKLSLTVRDQTIGVMTAMGESGLIPIDYGDTAGPDSRGMFGQRDIPSVWGSYTDRMDPFISATNFFKVEMTIPNRDTLEPTLVAHQTQRNADPYHYTRWWDPAQTVVQALAGVKTQAGPTSSDTAAQPQTNSTYATAGMRPQTVIVANTLGERFHLKTIGGYRPNSSPYDDPVYGHATGLAIDFMINDIPDGKATGDALAQYLQQHADDLGVQYVIWYQHIWSPGRADEGWRPMTDRGSPTQNHLDHVHLSLNGTGSGVVPPGGEGAAACPANGGDVKDGQGGEVTQSGWAAPARGPITSPFGPRVNPVTGVAGVHTGIDIGAACEAPIYAANAGTVVQAGPATGYGNLITIDHGSDVETRYGHMFNNGLLVQVGDQVKAGQQIARVGAYGNSTGCHLHFEVKQGGSFVDPHIFLTKVSVNTT